MKFTSFAVNTIHMEKRLVVKRTIGENQHLFLRDYNVHVYRVTHTTSYFLKFHYLNLKLCKDVNLKLLFSTGVTLKNLH